MDKKLKNGKTDGVSIAFDQEKLRVTCVERKYRVSDSKIWFVVTAKKELDENATEELLHEDIELKTFLENYQITDIVSVSVGKEPVNSAKKMQVEEISAENSTTKKNGEDTKNSDADIKNNGEDTKNSDADIKNYCVPKCGAKNEFMKRSELFDTLDLPERFVIKDYKKAIEEKGILITNSAMPYDDLERFEKQGKVTRIEKGKRGIVTFMTKRV